VETVTPMSVGGRVCARAGRASCGGGDGGCFDCRPRSAASWGRGAGRHKSFRPPLRRVGSSILLLFFACVPTSGKKRRGREVERGGKGGGRGRGRGARATARGGEAEEGEPGVGEGGNPRVKGEANLGGGVERFLWRRRKKQSSSSSSRRFQRYGPAGRGRAPICSCSLDLAVCFLGLFFPAGGLWLLVHCCWRRWRFRGALGRPPPRICVLPVQRRGPSAVRG
jgi:hypothetical protein